MNGERPISWLVLFMFGS